MGERTGKGCNSINMKSGVCLDEETYAAYLRQNDRKLKKKEKKKLKEKETKRKKKNLSLEYFLSVKLFVGIQRQNRIYQRRICVKMNTGKMIACSFQK